METLTSVLSVGSVLLSLLIAIIAKAPFYILVLLVLGLGVPLICSLAQGQ